ncbi:MAG: glycoside hydrolase family 16 protein [Candidatus Krumholzibacteriia bacterium]
MLRDDFEGAALDPALWFVPAGPGTFFGRTQIRPPSEPLEVSNGLIRLRLDTHNPTAQTPGDSFWGSEIVTQEIFARGTGLAFRARVRVVEPVPGGLVGSLFSFAFDPQAGVRDEIDFELLSNDIVADRGRVLTNVFDDADFSIPGDTSFVSVPGLDLTAFNEFEIQWLPDRIQWRVNGSLVREEFDTLADAPMTVRLNFWAPGASFAAAYDPDLQPASTPEGNEVFFYEVDFVEIRTVPASVPVWRWSSVLIVAVVVGVTGWAVRRRR